MAESQTPNTTSQTDTGNQASQASEEQPVKAGGRQRLFRLPRVPAKDVGFTLLAILVLAIAGWLVYSHVMNDKSIVVAGTKITQKQVNDYASDLSNFSAKTHEGFGGNPRQTAEDDLILNAALKSMVPKYNVTVTQAEMDAYLKPQYDNYGSKQAYQSYVNATGIADEIKIRNENIVYESKLESYVLESKQIFYVAISYDSPYVDGKSVADQAAIRAQAVETLKSKFLPLFDAGKSKEEIAAQTDVNYLPPNNNTDKYLPLFRNATPTVANYEGHYTTDPPYFNDVQADNSIPGLVSANAATNKLDTVGQNTGVITTQAGFVGIIRLEGKTGGTYGSWDQFLKAYKSDHHIQSLSFDPSITSHLAHGLATMLRPVASVYQKVTETVSPKAYATLPPGDSCSNHNVTYKFKAVDQTTGGTLAGMTVTSNRTDFGTDCATGSFTRSGTSGANGMVYLNDNCWRPSPGSFSVTAPPNYHSNTSITPDWNPATQNEAGGQGFVIYFLPNNYPPKGSLSLDCSGSIGKVTANFSDPDGGTSAYITVLAGSPDYTSTTVSGTSAAWNVPAANTTTGDWGVNLYVKDVGSGGSHTYQKVAVKTHGPCNRSPSGSLSLSCNPDGTGKVSANFGDADGGTSAYITILAGSPDYTSTTVSGTSATWNNIPIANTTVGDWGVNLYVKDVGPYASGDYKKVAVSTHARCDRPATGSVTSGACRQITGTAQDPDDTSGNLPIKVYEDGTSATGTARGGTTTSGGSFTYALPSPASSDVDWVSHAFYVYAVSIDPSGNSTGNMTYIGRVNIGPCGSVSCISPVDSLNSTNFNNGPPAPIVGSSGTFYVGIQINNATTAPPGATFSIIVKNPGGSIAKTYSGVGGGYSAGPPARVTSNNNTFTYGAISGSYGLNWTYYGASCSLPASSVGGGCATPPCSGPTPRFAPYFTTGGDVTAGAGFGAGACLNTNAGIEGWNYDGSTDAAGNKGYYGSGTNTAVFALKNIKHFATGLNPLALRTAAQKLQTGGLPNSAAPPPSYPYELSFANSNTTSSVDTTGNYGGGFSTLPCLPDYYGTAEADSSLPIDYTTAGKRTYSVNGPYTLPDPGAGLGNGAVVTIVVNGSVYINHNVFYQPYGSPDNAPRLTIIAKNGIYIDPSVTELHGVFIAQNGTFATCATAANAETTNYAQCSGNKLTVYGAVAAKSIHLDRSYGSLYGGNNGSSINDPSMSSSSDAAENFIYTPELWLSTDGTPTGGQSQSPVDAVTSLPPVL